MTFGRGFVRRIVSNCSSLIFNEVIVIQGFFSIVVNLLVSALVFGLIIFVHELGHFIAARLMGVKVNEFALGMGPRILKKQGKETLYSIRAFPVGGFCAMEGEDSDAVSDRSFGSKKVWRRFIVLVAGAVMNLVLGFVLVTIYCGVHTNMITRNPNPQYFTTVVGRFEENAASEASGLRVGDEILKVNGKGVVNFFEALIVMQSDDDGVMSMVVRRNGEKVKLDAVALSQWVDENGVSTPELDFIVMGEDKTVFTTLRESARMEIAVGRLVWRSLVDIATGNFRVNDLSGPVGIVTVISDTVDNVRNNGWQQIGSLILLAVMLTVNVGIFNLLPLPALDGGRIIFLLIELVIRKPVDPKYEGIIHAVGLIILLGFTVLITFKDIWMLFQ